MNTKIQEFIERMRNKSEISEDNSIAASSETTINTDKSGTVAEELRRQRERICFSVVNRGQVWYDTLTTVQKAELLLWYNAWLNVTETLKVPDMPCWIK